jgi:hypothetical protein
MGRRLSTEAGDSQSPLTLTLSRKGRGNEICRQYLIWLNYLNKNAWQKPLSPRGRGVGVRGTTDKPSFQPFRRIRSARITSRMPGMKTTVAMAG